MLTLFLTGALIAIVAGLAAKFGADRLGSTSRITWFEFALGTLVCLLVVTPAVTVIGVKQARASTVSYNEYWNGFEKSADVSVTNCTRDGMCRHTYDCDPYIETYTVQVPHTRTRSDGKGGTTTETYYTTETRTRTAYHSCPYAKAEYTYTVDSTLGDTYTMGSHWLPENPQQHRYRAFTAIPGYLPSGVPALWQAASNRLASGNPGGVTKVMKYENYILASQSTLLRNHSKAIKGYQAQGLMPNPSKGLIEPYLANKVYFVGPHPGSPQAWQEAMMRANGRIGKDRKGDLHLLLVTDPRITNPDEYALAVQAHFQDPVLGKNALSKNGLVVMAGSTDGGKTIAWARSFTGMPRGNEDLAVSLSADLVGTPMTPQALLALPGQDSTPAPAVVGTAPAPARVFDPAKGGAIIQEVLAEQGGFVRVCMKGCGSGDAGYTYLFEEIQPTGGQKAAILAVGLVLALGVWGALLALGIPTLASVRDGSLHLHAPGAAVRRRAGQPRQPRRPVTFTRPVRNRTGDDPFASFRRANADLLDLDRFVDPDRKPRTRRKNAGHP